MLTLITPQAAYRNHYRREILAILHGQHSPAELDCMPFQHRKTIMQHGSFECVGVSACVDHSQERGRVLSAPMFMQPTPLDGYWI